MWPSTNFSILVTDGVAVAEHEFETVGLISVERVVVQDLDLHLPYFQVIGGMEEDTWREMVVQLAEDEFALPQPFALHTAYLDKLLDDGLVNCSYHYSLIVDLTFERRFLANIAAARAIWCLFDEVVPDQNATRFPIRTIQ